MHAKYWLTRWQEARALTAQALPFVGRGVVYAYLWASLVVLAAIAALGQLSWAAMAGVIGPTVVLLVAAWGYDVYQLMKIIPERELLLRERAEEAARPPRPHVEFAGCRTRQNLGVQGLTGSEERPGRTPAGQQVGRIDVCQVAVRNKPPAGAKGSTASHAVALVEYFLPEGNEPALVLDHGKWAGHFLPGSYNSQVSPELLVHRDLYPNGEVHWIDVALKSKGQAEWYAPDAELFSANGWKDPDRLVAHQEVRVRITVLAEGLDDAVSAEYWLYNLRTGAIDITEARRDQGDPATRRVATETQRPRRSEQVEAQPERSGAAERQETPEHPQPTNHPDGPASPLLRDEFFADLARVSRKTPAKKSD